MLNELYVFASKDQRYVALRGYENRVIVNVRVDGLAITDLPGIGLTPTPEQLVAFVRHNIDAIREIAERKLERGDGKPEDHNGQPALGVGIGGTDFVDYLSRPSNRLSLAAFDPGAQATWVGRDGRFP
jgi:hypothetical protein